MEEFISWYAKERLKKLQRGSVKGFIADNQAIKSLNVFDKTRIDEIEKILQCRHLYTHQNGIVDEQVPEIVPDHEGQRRIPHDARRIPNALRVPFRIHQIRRRGSPQGFQACIILIESTVRG